MAERTFTLVVTVSGRDDALTFQRLIVEAYKRKITIGGMNILKITEGDAIEDLSNEIEELKEQVDNPPIRDEVDDRDTDYPLTNEEAHR